jgi:16S rRNA (guanine527-N7)-methyltransferase
MQALLDNGLAALHLDATPQQRAQWLAYVQLLDKWNNAYNLTAVRDPREMVSRHILDSLSVAEHIDSRHLLDVGAGAGLPSIPLAILWPDRQFTALDSNGKKTRFMEQARHSLGLNNLRVVQSRIEAFRSDTSFDGIVSRAFASLTDFVSGSQHLLAEDGTWWAMKAQLVASELSELPKPFKVSACLRLHVPNCEAERHPVIIRRAADGEVSANLS